ncbi:MAG: hypothetical protein F6K24_38430 [Okeania sp. SIO2D1]|nr:hypothetical protein [Okeania sp. SIO2D1]
MQTVIEKPLLLDHARQTGPKWVLQHFTWKQVVDRLLDVLIPSVKFGRPTFEPIIL